MATINTGRVTTQPGSGSGCVWIGLNLMFLLFLGIGGWYGWRSWTLVQFGGAARGTVVAIDVSSGEDGDTYAPVVAYTVNDRVYRMTGTYSSPPAFAINDRVTIRYDHADPSIARIDNWSELWLLPIIFIAVAVVFGGLFNAIMLGQAVRARRGV